MNPIEVPADKLKEMEKFYSCSLIASNKPVSSVLYQNKRYVITGSMGNGAAGITRIWGFTFVLLALYKGNRKPLRYDQHRHEVLIGTRERGYDGMIVTCEGQQVVLTGPQIEFIPTAPLGGQQTKLF